MFSRPFTDEEMLTVAASLEDYHKVFFTFWEMSSVRFSDRIPTACVQFMPTGKPEMLISETFWDSLNLRERLFVICHECLHVILNHGVRNGSEVPGATHALVNTAQDITINEMIVDLFGFNRDDLREWKKYCWIDTCFDDPTVIKRNETFIYYLEMLVKNPKKDPSTMPSTVDVHPTPGTGDKPAGGDRVDLPNLDPDLLEDLLGQLADDLTQEEIEKMIKASPDMRAGLAGGNLRFELDEKRAVKKMKFSSILKKLKRTRIKPVLVENDSFSREDRRYGSLGRHVSLPGKHEGWKPSRDKLLTLLFMDTSGSCTHMWPTFIDIGKMFMAEEDVFDLRSFIFGTSVVEILPGVKTVGGAGLGTNFGIIEEKVQECKAEYGKYPDCVVVVTDGDGTPVHPEAATRWVWLLTEGWNVRTYVPFASRSWTIDQVTF